MNSKTILFFNKEAPYRRGGAEKVIWELGKSMVRDGWDVHYLVPWAPAPPSIAGIKFHFVKTAGGPVASSAQFFLGAIPLYRRLLREFHPTLVYDNPSPLPFYPAHFFRGPQVVSKFHDVARAEFFLSKDHLRMAVFTLASDELFLRLLDGRAIVTVSESSRSRLAALVRHGSAIRIVPPGVDLPAAPPSLDQAAREPFVLFLSRLVKKKGAGYLLAAWKEIERRTDKFELRIAGDGPQAEALHKISRRLGLQRVRFLGDVDGEPKMDLFHRAALFALPTLFEGLPIVLLEAMMAGVPILATDTWGVRDLVVDGWNGALVQPKNAGQIAEAILDFMDDRAKYERYAARGWETVQAYSWEKVTRAEIEILETIAGNGAGNRRTQ